MVPILTARQVATDGAQSLAEALLQALHASIELTWQVTVNEVVVSLSAELSADTLWPPRLASLRVAGQEEVSLNVPTNASNEQLADVIDAGLQVVGFPSEEETPAQERNLQPLGVDPEGQVCQPLCLRQWHPNTCGHHVLFNIRRMFRGDSSLHDKRLFWSETLRNVARLARYGEESGRWPRSRVVGGVADEVHLRHLADTDDVLRDRVTILSSRECFDESLHHGRVCRVLDEIKTGILESHGFLLGATIHWYAVVVQRTDDGVQLWVLDSHNTPLTKLRHAEDVEELTTTIIGRWRAKRFDEFRNRDEWNHRPEAAVWSAVENGTEEWWKGRLKSSLFWRYSPMSVEKAKCHSMLDDVRHYLETLCATLYGAQI